MNTDWEPLRRWHRGDDSAHSGAVELLNGIEPEDRANSFELLMLALYAVTMDEQRLLSEFASRPELAGAFSAKDLSACQRNLAEQSHSSLDSYQRLSNRLAALPDIMPAVRAPYCPAAGPASDLEWTAAVVFGHLSQTIATQLGMPGELTALRVDQDETSKCNAVESYTEPWPQNYAARAMHNSTNDRCLYQLTTTPASIVCAVLADANASHDRHPKRISGDPGHPLIAVKSPLEITAPHLFTGAPGIAEWRMISADALDR